MKLNVNFLFKKQIVTVFFLFLVIELGVFAQSSGVSNPDPNRFGNEIDRFMEWDSKNSFPANAILFVGSSSIRLWHTRRSFLEFPVINRGFGGAYISDVNFFYSEVVYKYHPQLIVFYAGDNDIAGGITADQVFDDYQKFVEKVQTDFPACKIFYLPIKPSLLRWKYWPAMKQTNLRIKQLCEGDSNLYYIDTATSMLNRDGEPREELFVEDGLHLNTLGYQLWESILKPHLKKVYYKLKTKKFSHP